MRFIVFVVPFCISMLLFPYETAAQDSVRKASKSAEYKINSAAKELQKSLKKNDDSGIAKNYEILAQRFIDKGDFPKGEEYLKKALMIYTRQNKDDDRARVSRNIAKVQESQNNLDDAAKNYKAAGEVAKDKSSEMVNANDYKRLSNSANPKAQEKLVDSNIELLNKADKEEEVADAYVQKAEISLKKKESSEAIESYTKALPYAKNKPEKVIAINNEIAKVYASENQFDKAISINENLLADAQSKNDFDTQITQLQSLASIYFKKAEPEKAVYTLKQAYSVASQHGKTAEVRKSLSQLLTYYKSLGDDKNSLALYEQFFGDFERLIRADSSLVDSKAFQVNEEKIRQLESEKLLKDELITKKNMFNYFLLGSVLLLLLLFTFIVKALYSIKTRNKQIALQSLRREMNPHFIFNSLNSINQFISQNNELEANKYLSNYSNLMRNMMENSNKDFVTLSNEIEQLNKYLELEHMRFRDQFDYKISIDEHLDTDTTFIPNMLIQPHLENAIWHGLRYKETKGMLKLDFSLQNGKMTVTIDDDGIGMAKSQELKTRNQKVHQSRGITNTKERMALLNELYKKEITLDVAEKTASATGTIVKITFPLIEKI
jgi:two-component system sensor histidine kinase YesM